MGMIKSFPVRERPMARLDYVGSGGLSQIELLAILIGGPNQLEAAQAVTARFGKDLHHALIHELAEIPGIGEVTAKRIQAALELGRRFVQPDVTSRYQVTDPSAVAELLSPIIGQEEQECFAVVYLDTRNRVIDHEILYRGTLNTSLVRKAEVFRGAIRRNAASIVVAHNHPSGDPSPSPEDIAITRQLIEAGKLMEVELLDHLVIGRGRWYSLRERHHDTLWES